MTAGLDPTLTFSTLVAGSANQLALAAARAAAESPRPPFNPLYLHGREGLGKSHLLHAIGHRKLEVDPRATVRLVSWRSWSEGVRAALALGRGREYLVPFAEAGLLLVDDAHLLAEPPATPELLEVLVMRVERHLTTVLAANTPPSELFPPEDPAARLLGAGLVVGLGSPDSAMRWDILHRRSEAAAVELSDAVLAEVAALPFDTVQDLVGAASRLIAFQAVSPAPLDPAQARVLITGVLDTPVPDTGILPVAVQPTPRPVEARSADDADEFGSFLSDVVASVSQQVDEWRARIADAVLRWRGEGFQTARLEALLDQELPARPDLVLERYEADVAALRRLRDEVAELAPDWADQDVFSNPDRLAAAEEMVEQARTSELADHQPLADYRLDDLVEGTSNRAVFDAVRAVIAPAGSGPNPLLIVGGAGTGKTHLLHALGNALVERGHRGVVCAGTGRFAAHRQEAAEAGRLAGWRRRFRWASALLLDDIHHLSLHPEAQEDLSQLVTEMLRAGRPVVVTSAVPVSELTGLAPALLRGLASGSVLDLPGPDREVRLGIVRQALAASDAAGDASLVDYLAGRPADSARGVLVQVQQVLRAAATARVPATQMLAREVLEMAPGARRALSPLPGVLGPSVGGSRLREKLIEVWPSVGDRLIEDLR